MKNTQTPPNQEPEGQALALAQKLQPWFITTLAVVITALVVGGGVFWLMNNRLASEQAALGQKIADLQSQAVQPQPTTDGQNQAQQSESTGYSTFKHPKYPVSFDFPNNFKYGAVYVSTHFESNNNMPIGFSFWAGPTVAHGAEYVGEKCEERTVSVGGISALLDVRCGWSNNLAEDPNSNIRMQYEKAKDDKNYFVYFTKDSIEYGFDYTVESSDYYKIGEQILDQILSSFKFLDPAPVSTDAKTKEIQGETVSDFPISFSIPINWNAVIDYYEGVLGGAAGPVSESTFRIALDETPILIIGRGSGYPVIVYGVKDNALAKYNAYFSNSKYEKITIPGADLAVRTPQTTGVGGDYFDVYIKKDKRIYVVSYNTEHKNVGELILGTWKFKN